MLSVGFVPINDAAGHQVGDEVLKIIAHRLLEHSRSTDICARMGGDEFAVIATQLETVEQVHQIAEKLLEQCCDRVEIDNKQYNLGASIGISMYPQHGNTLHQLLKNADDAMYEVKKNGKSGYQVFGNKQLNVDIEIKEIKEIKKTVYRDELITQGGRIMVPCLRIEEGGEVKWLYESTDIIQFLNTRFG